MLQPSSKKTIRFEEGLESLSSAPPRDAIAPKGSSLLSKLEVYAHTDIPEAFIALVETIDWSRQFPDALIRVIALALRLNLNKLATALAQKGDSLFPDDLQIKNVFQILSQPRVRNTPSLPERELDVSRQWLHDHANQYQNKWLAIHAGNLIGVANSLHELQSMVGSALHSEKTLITQVL